MTPETPSSDGRPARSARERRMASVESLDKLRGAHPDALRDLFLEGAPTNPTAFFGEVPAMWLAAERLARAHVLFRPVVKWVSQNLSPWGTIAFESGGTAGRHRALMGSVALCFRCEVAASALDGRPALLLSYRDLGNRWPISLRSDELRDVGDGIAIGPCSVDGRLLFWWGMSRG